MWHHRLVDITFKDRPINAATKDTIVMALVLFGLRACQPGATGGGAGGIGTRPSPSAGTASAYRSPPTVTGAAQVGGDRITLTGRAEAGARVRLATPAGQTLFAKVGADGVWRLDVPAPAAPRLFGLASIEGRRLVQSEGYIVVAPRGLAAQLRAGAGARVIGAEPVGPVIQAVDFDSKGGAVVSGRAAPRAALDIWVDGGRRGHGQATDDGQFSLALDEPLTFTGHRVEVVDGPRRASINPSLSLAAPLTRGPYRDQKTPSGWRIDWITPGGGLQTTVLITNDGGHA